MRTVCVYVYACVQVLLDRGPTQDPIDVYPANADIGGKVRHSYTRTIAMHKTATPQSKTCVWVSERERERKRTCVYVCLFPCSSASVRRRLQTATLYLLWT